MGTISVNKLGGLSLALGPVIALIGYFLQPGGMLIDAADPADAQEGAEHPAAFHAGLAPLPGSPRSRSPPRIGRRDEESGSAVAMAVAGALRPHH